MSKMVTFIQHAIPGLKAGEYSINIKQQLLNKSAHMAEYQAQRRFAVQGERFHLNPTEVLATFPPEQARGEYLNTLAHIVFDRKMLPWIRALDTTPDNPLESQSSWLALLVFADDQAPATQVLKVHDLIPAGRTVSVPGSDDSADGSLDAGVLCYPFNHPASDEDYVLDVGESPDQTILAIDVPADLFNAVAPSEQDMAYLAHVRLVEMQAKSTLGEGDYSLVIGNRFAAKGKNVVHLVSLEGLGDSLPDGPDYTPRLPPDIDALRLVSLKSWTFTADSDGKALETALKGLQPGSLSVPFPEHIEVPEAAVVADAIAAQVDGETTAEQGQVLARNAIAMGYVAMSHQTRSGSRTVSWYRGPLLPHPLATTLKVPLAYPEQASAYNPRTGLLDHSYGAAWQLGQWLALQDKAFSTQLYQWKQQLSQDQVAAGQDQLLQQSVGALKTASRQAAARQSDQPSPRQRKQQALLNILDGQLQKGHRRSARRRNNQLPKNVPEKIIRWLSSLKRLNGVPFNYLIPDERQLPPESMGFFHLDGNWLAALTDGAYSLGRTTAAEMVADGKTATRVLAQVDQRLFANARSGSDNPVTGLVLRSGVVSGWPGLTVQGYRETFGPTDELTTPLPLLRFERLNDELMLALFDGEVATVMFREPEEGLHFGAYREGDQYTTALRYLIQGDDSIDPGEEIAAAEATLAVKSDGLTLKVTETAAQLHAALAQHNALNEPSLSDFTAEEFAVQMVRGATEVRFERR